MTKGWARDSWCVRKLILQQGENAMTFFYRMAICCFRLMYYGNSIVDPGFMQWTLVKINP